VQVSNSLALSSLQSSTLRHASLQHFDVVEFIIRMQNYIERIRNTIEQGQIDLPRART
jgi:hypothetical protein